MRTRAVTATCARQGFGTAALGVQSGHEPGIMRTWIQPPVLGIHRPRRHCHDGLRILPGLGISVARDIRDEELKKEIIRVREKRGRKLYGAKKIWHELDRDGIEVARCTVERLMREMGIAGARSRRKRPRTTMPGPAGQERPSDLVGRDFTAPAPNRRWVADITYVETAAGFVYAAFILDLFSRMITGWQVSDNLRAELALDALEMAVWSRGDRMDGQLVHHSDRGVILTRLTPAQSAINVQLERGHQLLRQRSTAVFAWPHQLLPEP